jgi:hypothetical protein
MFIKNLDPDPDSPKSLDPDSVSMNEEIRIGEQYCQTISNLGHAALLRRCELPPINKSAELTQGAL